jgi:hypothetical protein
MGAIQEDVPLINADWLSARQRRIAMCLSHTACLEPLPAWCKRENLRGTQTGLVVLGLIPRAVVFGLICGFPFWTAAAQNYMYNQAALATGNKPSAVVVADFNGDGKLDLAVTNESDNTISVLLTKSDGSFASRVDYPVGNTPLQLASADFNGDGKIDLAVVNSKDNTISILLGVGDGTFGKQVTYPTGDLPVAITAADFNGDKHIDLAVANQTDGTVSVLFGNGDGSFISQTPAVLAGTTPFSIATADMNGDGKPDLLLLSGTVSANATLYLLTNKGNGTFNSGSSLLAGAIGGMAVGDINHDGNLDIAVTLTTSNSVSILLGNGTGSFQTLSLDVTSSLGAPPQSIIVGDFNQDGNLDLAITEYYFVAIYLGKGDGTFQDALRGGLPSTTTPQVMAVGDFNNDGLLDLAAIIQDENVALVFLGNSDGTLASRADITLPASGGTGGAVAADFNGDRKQDLAIAQFNQPQQTPIQGFATLLLGNGNATFQTAIATPVSDIGINGTVGGDFNGDGNADIATASVDANGGLAVFLGNGNGTFGPPISSFIGLTGLNLGPMIAGDFNRDGKSDLVVVSENNANNFSPMYVLLSQGDGTFKENFLFNLAYGFVPDIATADFNHDGYLDLAVVSDNQILVFLGHGDGSFATSISYSTNFASANSVVAGDFDGDGIIDIVVGTPGAMLFFAGNGDGTFRTPISTPNPTNGIHLVAGEFNGDGKLDLAIAGSLSDSIMLGNGDGTFQTPSPFHGTYYPRNYAVGDFNSDGILDLVLFSASNTSGVSPQTASVWHSTPTLSFSASFLHFDPQAVGTTSTPKILSLSNIGNAPLVLAGIVAHGDFNETNTCMTTPAVGQGCTISVAFTPSANGSRSGNLTLTDNSGPGTQTLSLSGLAVTPDFTISATPGSRLVTAGGSASYTLTLTPGDGFRGTVQVTCTGAPSKSTCTPTPASLILDGANTASVMVAVNTTAASFAPLTHFSARRWTRSSAVPGISVCCLLFPCLFGTLALTQRRRAVRVIGVVTFMFVLGVSGGCGGGNSSGTVPPSNPGTPAGTYNLTLSTSSGTLTHTTTVSLTVK